MGASMRRLLLLGAGFEQIAAMKAARVLGLHVTAFDNQSAPPGARHADDFVQVNIKDAAALRRAAERVKPDGVFCHAAELAIETARLADQLGLPGIGEDAARRATDKRLRTAALRAAGVITPDYAVLEKDQPADEWIAAFKALGSVVVCKPPDLAGARGVMLVTDEEALLSYRDTCGGVSAESFLMERYTPGPQLSSESVIVGGRVAWTALAERHYDTTLSLRPHLIEDGHSMPADVPSDLKARIEETIEAAAGGIGIRNGVVKGDLILPDNGDIVVIEMAGRTSGGRFCDFVTPHATGVNILPPLIQMALGDAPDMHFLTPSHNRGVSQRFLFPPEGHQITADPDVAVLRERARVIEAVLDPSLQKGAHTKAVRCHGDRAGYVICEGETREEADRLALAAVAAPFFSLSGAA